MLHSKPETTAVFIFQHVDIFYNLIDKYSVSKGAVLDFSISAFEAELLAQLEAKKLKPADSRRVMEVLDLDNLNACGMLAFIDHRRGCFQLQPSLLEVIQNLDSKRIRELGQPDLDAIYSEVHRTYAYFTSVNCRWYHGDTRFSEHLDSLFATLQGTLGKIDRNVRALEGSLKRLSLIVDDHEFGLMRPTDQVRTALEEIYKIYERNVIPTLRFLDEKAMAKNASAMYLIGQIVSRFKDRHTFARECQHLLAIESQLLSYSEPVSKVRAALQKYLAMDAETRKRLDHIEAHYNQLRDKAMAIRDGRQNFTTLSVTDPVFSPASILAGYSAKDRRLQRKALLNFADCDSRALADEHLRCVQADYKTFNDNKRDARELEAKADTSRDRLQVLRIQAAMDSFQPSLPLLDLYADLHQHLLQHVDDYRLSDLMDAQAFVEDVKHRIIYRKSSLEYRGERLEYLIRRGIPT